MFYLQLIAKKSNINNDFNIEFNNFFCGLWTVNCPKQLYFVYWTTEKILNSFLKSKKRSKGHIAHPSNNSHNSD